MSYRSPLADSTDPKTDKWKELLMAGFRSLKPPKSFARNWMENKLKGLYCNGAILDLGSGESKNSSLMMLGHDSCVTSVDNRPVENVDLVADIEKRLPLSDGSFDFVLAMNILEHVFNVQDVFSEVGRVLKPGGTLYLFVPYLYPRHITYKGDVVIEDYFRFGPIALERMLRLYGQFRGQIQIDVCGFGPFVAAYNYIHLECPWKLLSRLVFMIAHVLDSILFIVSRRRGVAGAMQNRWAIAYWVSAVK